MGSAAVTRAQEPAQAAGVGISGDQSRKWWKKRRISSGQHDETWLVQHRDTGALCAAHLTAVPSMPEAELDAAYGELKCLAQVSHHGIVRYVEDFMEGPSLWFITEHADGGDLQSQILRRHREQDYFQEDTVLFMFIQLALALDHVHCRRLVHRAVKSSNILLTSECLVKLGGFGLSRDYEDVASNVDSDAFGGTACYAAPELWRGERYSRKADMWSLGVVLFEMAQLRLPFRSFSFAGMCDLVTEIKPDTLTDNYSKGLNTVVQTLLTKDSRLRPTTRRAFLMPYMRSALKRYEPAVEACASLSRAVKDALLADAASVQDCPVELTTPSRETPPSLGVWSSTASENRTPVLDVKTPGSEDARVNFAEPHKPRLSQTLPQSDAALPTFGSQTISPITPSINPESITALPGSALLPSAAPRSILRRAPSKKSVRVSVATAPEVAGLQRASTTSLPWSPVRAEGVSGPIRKYGRDGEWNSRYLRLTAAALIICTGEVDTEGKALCLSRVRTVAEVPPSCCGAAHVFAIEATSGKSTWLQAPSAAEAEMWLSAIRSALMAMQP